MNILTSPSSPLLSAARACPWPNPSGSAEIGSFMLSPWGREQSREQPGGAQEGVSSTGHLALGIHRASCDAEKISLFWGILEWA